MPSQMDCPHCAEPFDVCVTQVTEHTVCPHCQKALGDPFDDAIRTSVDDAPILGGSFQTIWQAGYSRTRDMHDAMFLHRQADKVLDLLSRGFAFWQHAWINRVCLQMVTEAMGGDVPMQFKVACAYGNSSGKGTDRVGFKYDRFIFMRWLRLAAVNGSPDAQLRLYTETRSVTNPPPVVSDAEPMRWLHASAAGGNVEAQFMLGHLYSLDEKHDPELTNSIHWFTCAAEKGHLEARYCLGCCVRSRGDIAGATRLIAAAAEDGFAQAQFTLGRMYEVGEGVPVDLVVAQRWLRKAREQGHPEARLALTAMRWARRVECSKVNGVKGSMG